VKIGLISDIHGNYEALKEVLSELDKLKVSEIYCLGDVVGYYSQVNECCDELRLRNIPCVMGNHDWYIASGGYCSRSQSVNDCLSYLRGVITVENIEWLRSFPIQRFIQNIHMVHGGWADPIDEYLNPNEEYFSRIQGDFFASGHTHLQSLNQFTNKTYCNPGSVGQPRDNDPRAAFAVIHGDRITLHRVDYDIEKVFGLMHKAGFNDHYYSCLKPAPHNFTEYHKKFEDYTL